MDIKLHDFGKGMDLAVPVAIFGNFGGVVAEGSVLTEFDVKAWHRYSASVAASPNIIKLQLLKKESQNISQLYDKTI